MRQAYADISLNEEVNGEVEHARALRNRGSIYLGCDLLRPWQLPRVWHGVGGQKQGRQSGTAQVWLQHCLAPELAATVAALLKPPLFSWAMCASHLLLCALVQRQDGDPAAQAQGTSREAVKLALHGQHAGSSCFVLAHCSAKTATRPRKPKATPEEEAAELDAHNRNRIAVR